MHGGHSTKAHFLGPSISGLGMRLGQRVLGGRFILSLFMLTLTHAPENYYTFYCLALLCSRTAPPPQLYKEFRGIQFALLPKLVFRWRLG